jgi:hypothetical protein
MLPAIARATIAGYTGPSDLVFDPMCGIGTTLVDAVHLGREAIGVEYEPHRADMARRNVCHARDQGASGTAEVIPGDALRLDELVAPWLRGRVGLVLTSPPYGASVHGQAKPVPGRGVIKADDRYSRDRGNLAHQPIGKLLRAVTDILASSLDRCLRAFEGGRLSEASCGHRVREIEGELATLEAERAVLEARRDLSPSAPTASLLSDLRRNVADAVAQGEPEQVKELLAAVVSRIVVESRASIQPFFVAPSVRTLEPSRRRREHCRNPNAAGQVVWVDVRQWGSVGMTARD